MTIKRDASNGKLTVTFWKYDGTPVYFLTTINAIPQTNAAYWHMYVNSGSFKWLKGALCDPAGTATFADWDAAYDS